MGRGKIERAERCGGADLRHNSLSPHGDPRRAFFMSEGALLDDIKNARDKARAGETRSVFYWIHAPLPSTV